jgi:hypothetical protein
LIRVFLRKAIRLWEGILSYIIPRAKIIGEDAVHVKAYLLANAAKINLLDWKD